MALTSNRSLVIRDFTGRFQRHVGEFCPFFFQKNYTGVMYSSLQLLTVGSNCGDTTFLSLFWGHFHVTISTLLGPIDE